MTDTNLAKAIESAETALRAWLDSPVNDGPELWAMGKSMIDLIYQAKASNR